MNPDQPSPVVNEPTPLHQAIATPAELLARIQELEQTLLKERQRADLLSDFVEQGSIGMHWVGPDGTILWANTHELTLLGYSREEYIGRHIAEFHLDAPIIAEILERLGRGETLQDHEARLRCKDGSMRIVLINSNVLWQDGKFVQTRCFTRDITHVKRAHQALVDSEARSKALMAAANDAIILVDCETQRIVEANQQLADLVSRDLVALTNADLTDLFVPQSARETCSQLCRLTADGSGLITDTLLLAANGRLIPVEVSAKAIRMEGRQLVLCIFHDLTEQRNAAAELAIKAADLARSNEELSQFAHTASHDLQQPLRMMASYVSLLEEQTSLRDDEKARKYLHRVGSAAHRMLHLVRSLLGYAKLGHGAVQREPVMMLTVVQEAIENLSSLIEQRKAHLTYGELPTITGDRTLLIQLMQNLIANAITYTRDPHPSVRIDGKRREDAWMFSVTDNGIGIEPADQGKIFEIFQRLHGDQDFSGSGIGLATCKRIIDRHRGKIWVESTPGLGSIFFFAIPFTDTSAGASGDH